jgi:hypothetical protein
VEKEICWRLGYLGEPGWVKIGIDNDHRKNLVFFSPCQLRIYQNLCEFYILEVFPRIFQNGSKAWTLSTSYYQSAS